MRIFALICVVAFSCKPTEPKWTGIGEDRQCSAFKSGLAVCVAGGLEYTCVATSDDGCGTPRGVVNCALASGSAREVMKRHLEQEQQATQ